VAAGHSTRLTVGTGEDCKPGTDLQLGKNSKPQLAASTAEKISVAFTHFVDDSSSIPRQTSLSTMHPVPTFNWEEGKDRRTMTQAFNEWVEDFSSYTKTFGQVHPVMAFKATNVNSWLKVQWNSMARADPTFPAYASQMTLPSLQWIEVVAQKINAKSLKPEYEVVTGRSAIMEMDQHGSPLLMKFIGENRFYFDNEDIAPKEKVNFTLKALEKNFPQMLEILRNTRARYHSQDTSYDWVLVRIGELANHIQETAIYQGKHHKPNSTMAAITTTNSTSTKRSVPPEPRKPMEQRQCFNCGKFGHIKKNCFKRRQEEGNSKI
jgi:hypothetical protein